MPDTLTATRTTARLRRSCGIALLAVQLVGAGASLAGPVHDPAHAHEHEPRSANAHASHDTHGHAHEQHARQPAKHPTPRPHVTGETVIAPERLIARGLEEEAQVYAGVRDIPRIVDGIYCYCHCARHSGHYSLLTCFESGHAAGCDACLGSGALAARLHAEGRTLDEIRAAVDAKFGGTAPR